MDYKDFEDIDSEKDSSTFEDFLESLKSAKDPNFDFQFKYLFYEPKLL